MTVNGSPFSEGPLEPINLDTLLFITRDGIRHIIEPNPRERELARMLLSDRAAWQPGLGEQSLATALAAVREGSTLEGPRSSVGGEQHVSGRLWDHEPALQLRARQTVRVQWMRELHEHGLRPIGWPPIVVEHYAWRPGYATSTPAADDRHAGMVLLTTGQVEAGARADYVCLRIEGEAVPDR